MKNPVNDDIKDKDNRRLFLGGNVGHNRHRIKLPDPYLRTRRISYVHYTVALRNGGFRICRSKS